MNATTSLRERGVAAVEFALVLPLFILMLMGMLDYGWFFFIELNATHAAREGARTATTVAGACPNPEAEAAGQAAASAYLSKIGQTQYATITVTCETAPTGAPEFEATIQVLFPQLTGFSILPMPRQGDFVAANARATMRGVD